MVITEGKRQSQGGFTLVELAIVMVIIGLLMGGILKGQELIANAKVSATVSQVKGVDAAINSFFDKYNAYPGDIINPQARLPGCTDAPCTGNGTGGVIGNARIEGGNVATSPALANEAGKMFVHLQAADLVSGITPANGTVFGGVFPTVRAGGGMWVAYTTNGLANSLPAGKHYAALAGTTGAVANGDGALNASTAAQIDRKLDDGSPNSGTVQTVGTNCFTGTGATAIYDEANNAGTCTIYARMLN